MVLGHHRHSSASRYGPRPGEAESLSGAVDRELLRLVDGSFAGTLFLVPLIMGGRHAVGQLVLTILSVTAAWAWAARQSLRRNAKWQPAVATPLILLGMLLVVLQTIPLPHALLTRLSPSIETLLPQWTTQGHSPRLFGPWPCLSFTPAETLAGLVIFLDLSILFLVAVQRIRCVEDVERLLRWCAGAAIAMACLGLAQLFAGNGKFFWFYQHPFSNPAGEATGSFTNRNHFAHFLALGAGPLIWWLIDAMRRKRERKSGMDLSVAILAVSLGMVLFANLLSLSRGGIMAMLLAAAIATAVCCRSSSAGRRFLAVMVGVGAVTALSLAIFGFDRVSARVETMSSSLGKIDSAASRSAIWATGAKAIPSRLFLGAGVGSFGELYPIYEEHPDAEGREPSHAECGYLQVLIETGFVGLTLVLAGIGLCGWWCLGGIASSTPNRLRLCAGAIAASLAASVAHAVVDFVWYVPACMAVVSILAACALRVRQMSRQEEHPQRGQHGSKADFQFPDSSRLAATFRLSLSWPVALVALSCAGVWMITDRIGPAVAQTYWDDYLVARRTAEKHDANKPDAPLADADTQYRWIASLEKVVRWQPTHIQAHLKLVETHRRLFDILQQKSDNPMSLIQIGDAVFNEPRFRSRDALMEWLPRAVGPHWVHLTSCLDHARRSLYLCPLEGRAYVHVAELSLLWSLDRTASAACIEQALRVRPFDGEVLYAAGNQALLAGNEPLWRARLKQAFRWGLALQHRIIADRITGSPQDSLPLVIDDILREFQPDLENARFLRGICANRCSPEQLVPLTRYCANVAETEAAATNDADAATVWIEAYALRNRLQEPEAALRCVRKAVESDPGSYNAHYHLGYCLLQQSHFVEAEKHLRWCLQRTPNDRMLESHVREAFKGRLDLERRAAKNQCEPVTR